MISEAWIAYSVEYVDYRLHDRGMESRHAQRDFSLLQNVQTGSGAHPASHSMGTGVLFRK